jgi:pyruvate dehydrogenase E1 component
MSATSWSELARDGMACERTARLDGAAAVPQVARLLGGSDAPVIAISDYVRTVPESIRAFVPRERGYTTLGTDGFGRSDTRAELRAFFEVDAASIALAAVHALHAQERADDASLAKARARVGGGEAPWRR